jgi:hypothetical protein
VIDRLRSRWALLVLLAIAIAVAIVVAWSQARTEIQVASGEIESGLWTAWAYDPDSAPCLEIRASGRDAERLCGLTRTGVRIWRPDAPAGEASFLAGTAGDPDAETVRVTLTDGAAVEGEIAWPDETSALGFFVLSLEPGADPAQLEVLAFDGSVIDSVSTD